MTIRQIPFVSNAHLDIMPRLLGAENWRYLATRPIRSHTGPLLKRWLSELQKELIEAAGHSSARAHGAIDAGVELNPIVIGLSGLLRNCADTLTVGEVCRMHGNLLSLVDTVDAVIQQHNDLAKVINGRIIHANLASATLRPE